MEARLRLSIERVVMRCGLVFLTMLAGCGGDDAPAINQPPAFTSAAQANFEENGQGAALRLTASDAEGAMVRFEIAGGPDAAQFTLVGGELRFASPPDFDLPGDADGDNVYEIQVRASDGVNTTSQTLKITVTNSKEDVAVRRVASGFIDPVAIAPVSDTVVLVAVADGTVFELDPTTGRKVELLKIADIAPKGLISMTGTGSYAVDRRLFVLYRDLSDRIVLQDYLRNPAGPMVPNNFGPALSFPALPDVGGWIGGEGDKVILAIGNPSSGPVNEGYYGKLIEISPNPDPYAGASPSFFIVRTLARGLHEPVNAARDGAGYLVADRGTTIADEISFVDFAAVPVELAWPAKEGSKIATGGPVPNGVVDPLFEYARKTEGAVGRGIVGGAVSVGTSILDGQYVFADRGGAIFTIDVSSLLKGEARTLASAARRDADFVPDVGKIDHPLALTRGQTFSIYILDEDGEVFLVN